MTDYDDLPYLARLCIDAMRLRHGIGTQARSDLEFVIAAAYIGVRWRRKSRAMAAEARRYRAAMDRMAAQIGRHSQAEYHLDAELDGVYACPPDPTTCPRVGRMTQADCARCWREWAQETRS